MYYVFAQLPEALGPAGQPLYYVNLDDSMLY